MARGYPDYQNPVNKVAGRLVDFSAIVVSQLGMSPLDGLGRLVWFDKFHGSLSAWYIVLPDADDSAVICTDVSEVPPCCLRLTPSVTVVGGGPSVYHTQGFTIPSPSGLEVSMRVNAGHVRLYMEMALYYSGTVYYMQVYYLPVLRQFVLVSASPDTVLYTLPVAYSPGTWLTVKLVVDWINKVGMHVLIGDLSFDISAYAPRTAATAFVDSLEINLGARGLSAAALPQYLGHVYLTMDEP
jgi:hypothetical protein